MSDGRGPTARRLAGALAVLLVAAIAWPRIAGWLRRAADGKQAEREYALGIKYLEGDGVSRDDARAAGWFTRAAERGHPEAQNNLGFLFASGRGVEQSDRQAVDWYRRAAEQGSAIAQRNLGTMYLEGRGVERDEREALAWFRRAAEQGYAPAQASAGWMYDEGVGVAEDDAAAVAWYRRATAQGDGYAQSRLGWMLLHGEGAARDPRAAETLLRQAAEQGDPYSELLLGWYLHVGYGGSPDYAEALRLYERAARAGAVDSYLNIGTLYADGSGVASDRDKARRYYRVAVDGGSELARRMLAVAEAPGPRALERRVAAELAALGYAVSEAGGLEAPIRAFQSEELLPVDGRPSFLLLDRLLAAALERRREGLGRRGEGADVDPPRLEIPDRIDTDLGRLELVGRVGDRSAVVEVLVEGRPVIVGEDGTFLVTRGVPLGASRIRVTALDEWGNEAETLVSIHRVAAPPARPATALAPEVLGSYHALVIGNDRYGALRDLETAARDARAVAELLRADYGFEVTLLQNATRFEILTALEEYRGSLTEHDNFLLYYAGHGDYDRQAERAYWLPVDADADHRANWISSARIVDHLKAAAAKHVLVIADSCFAGMITRGIGDLSAAGDRNLARLAGKRARLVMTSGGNEPVMDAGGGDHSVFAAALLSALRENPGIVDGTRLFSLIREPVTWNSLQTPEYDPIHLAGHDGGDFLFARRQESR